MPCTSYQPLPILLHFCQDKQSPASFRGTTAEAVPCAVSGTVRKDAAAASLPACSASGIPLNRGVPQDKLQREGNFHVQKR